MSGPEVTVATPADRERVVGSMVAAFAADPVLRYLFPDEATYPGFAALFFGRLFDRRVGHRTVWTVAGVSVAMWDPPRAGAADPPGDDAFTAALPADVRARVDAYNRAAHDAVAAAVPDTPFWYLGVLGTHPEHAGRRWGHAVMAEGVRRAEADGLPAVLETATSGNVGVYRRAGWRVVGEADGPVPIWVMRQG